MGQDAAVVEVRVKHLRMDEQVRVFNNERLGFRIQLIVVLVGGLKSLTKSVRRTAILLPRRLVRSEVVPSSIYDVHVLRYLRDTIRLCYVRNY